jgi:hypothetical protein
MRYQSKVLVLLFAFSIEPVLRILSTKSISEEGNELGARLITVTENYHLSNSPRAFTNGEPSSPVSWEGNDWTWTARLIQPKIRDKHSSLENVPKDPFIIMFASKADNGEAAGSLIVGDEINGCSEYSY